LRHLLPLLSRVYGIDGEYVDRAPRGEIAAYIEDLNRLMADERMRR